MSQPPRKSSRLSTLDRDRTAGPEMSKASKPKPNSKMQAELHEIDRHGDLLMKLVRMPNPGKSSRAALGYESIDDEEDDKSDEEFEEDDEDSTAEDEGDAAMDVDIPYDEGMETEEEAEETDLEDEENDWPMLEDSEEPEPQPVHVRVSSKHMIMASPFFRSMLDNDTFEEGGTLRSKGSVEVSFPEDNPDAFLIILKIIHGVTRQVPREVSLKMLTELAILVDKYQILEVIEPFSDIWIQKLKDAYVAPDIQVYSIAEELPWLFIYWVFEKEEEFLATTLDMQDMCDETFEHHIKEGLPIPQSVINGIKESRTSLIRKALDIIYDLIARFTAEDDNVCEDGVEEDSFTCDAMMLGSLLKGAAQIGIWPKLEAPYIGQTFKDLNNNIAEMKIIDLSSYKDGHVIHGHSKLIQDSLVALEAEYCGLNLWDVKQKR